MVKVIIFDLGGVIVEVDYQRFLKEMSQATNIAVSELIQLSADGIMKNFSTGFITGAQFHELICKKLGQALSLEAMKQLWLFVLGKQKDDVVQIITSLQKNYSLALLSNTDPWHFEFCRQQFPILKNFKHVFLSYEEHVLKPDPQFYQIATSKMNMRPTDCLFIDDLLENIQSARNVGFHAIHFQNAQQLQQELADYQINLSY